MVCISAFFEVRLYSVHVYGRGTLYYSTHQCFFRSYTLLRSCLWERDTLLWYASVRVLSSRSHFTPCMSMKEGRSVMVRISAFLEVTVYSVHVYGRGTLRYGTPQWFLRGDTLLRACLWERDALLWYASVLSLRSHFYCMHLYGKGTLYYGDSQIPHTSL